MFRYPTKYGNVHNNVVLLRETHQRKRNKKEGEETMSTREDCYMRDPDGYIIEVGQITGRQA